MKLRDPETLNKVTLEHDNPPSGLPVVIEQTERTLFYQTKRVMAFSAHYQLIRFYQSFRV